MTRNLFLGADLRPVYAALSDRLADVPAAVAGIAAMVRRTDFPGRARAIAGEIESARPDLIGLQEAAVWRSGPSTADHLELLEAALAGRGLAYRRVATATNGVVELGGVGLTDRDAILARADLEVAGASGGSFSNSLPVRTAHGDFPLRRGWASVDAGGIRFITTHLETGAAPAVQMLQMGELLAGPADTPLPVAMAGDFNARSGTPAYELARAGGFEDAGPPGPTCCHTPPLEDPGDELRSRIDLILTRGLDVTAAATVGAFTDGRWPSDHAGVVATLEPAG